MRSIADVLKQGSESLKGTDNPLLEVQLLLAKVLACDRIKLITWPEKMVNDDQIALYQAFIQRRIQHEPLAYILGYKEFWSLNFKVSPHVLVPRPDTEILVETVLEKLPTEALTLIELGTGSGAIACALAHERSNWNIIASDISIEALNIAKENASLLRLPNITFIQSNWFERIPRQSVAAIISNPPYLSENDSHLKDDLLHEPRSALVSGTTGLEAYEAIIANAKHYLVPNGLIVFEHGFEQAVPIQQLLQKANYLQITTINDLAGQPRVTFAFNS